ncbi:hypothetical protein D9M70_559130 [compost metagenome]
MLPVLLADEDVQNQVGSRGVQEKELGELLTRQAGGQSLKRARRCLCSHKAGSKTLANDVVQSAC